MNNIKKIWVKSMDKVMLNCDTATLLITRGEYEKLGCLEQLQLKMHLAGCKFCRRFKKQSEFISYALKQAALPQKEDLKLHLSDQQKENMKKKMGV